MMRYRAMKGLLLLGGRDERFTGCSPLLILRLYRHLSPIIATCSYTRFAEGRNSFRHKGRPAPGDPSPLIFPVTPR